jgi:hypothetical protein
MESPRMSWNPWDFWVSTVLFPNNEKWQVPKSNWILFYTRLFCCSNLKIKSKLMIYSAFFLFSEQGARYILFLNSACILIILVADLLKCKNNFPHFDIASSIVIHCQVVNFSYRKDRIFYSDCQPKWGYFPSSPENSPNKISILK